MLLQMSLKAISNWKSSSIRAIILYYIFRNAQYKSFLANLLSAKMHVKENAVCFIILIRWKRKRKKNELNRIKLKFLVIFERWWHLFLFAIVLIFKFYFQLISIFILCLFLSLLFFWLLLFVCPLNWFTVYFRYSTIKKFHY